MTAETARSLYGILFGLFLAAMGVLQLLKPELESLGGNQEDQRASDFKLRYGDGGEDLRKVPVSPRWVGYTLIGLGLFHIAIPRFGGPSSLFLIVMGGFLLAVVLFFHLAGPWLDARRLRRHQEKLARLAAASDTYSDELRELHANPPLVMSKRRQLLTTAILTLFGGAFLALGLTIPR